MDEKEQPHLRVTCPMYQLEGKTVKTVHFRSGKLGEAGIAILIVFELEDGSEVPLLAEVNVAWAEGGVLNDVPELGGRQFGPPIPLRQE